MTDTSTEALAQIYRLSNIMLAEWKRVDPKSKVAKYPAFYIANFADMARVVFAEIEGQNREQALAAERDALRKERDALRQALLYMVNHAGQLERDEGIFWEATEIARAALDTKGGDPLPAPPKQGDDA